MVRMTIWAVLAVTLISIAGDQFGYALSLAGVAGLVISLGVTADSYIVFFERLKDEVRSGKSPRAQSSRRSRVRTRCDGGGDFVTIIAAGSYLTAVSSVRGFALTLGVATLLDLFVVWFFKRPTVFLIAKEKAREPARVRTHERCRRRSHAGERGCERPTRARYLPWSPSRTCAGWSWNRWFAISGLLVTISLAGFLFGDLNFSMKEARASRCVRATVDAEQVQATLEGRGSTVPSPDRERRGGVDRSPSLTGEGIERSEVIRRGWPSKRASSRWR